MEERLCKMPNCDVVVRQQGLCSKHYNRMYLWGSPHISFLPLKDILRSYGWLVRRLSLHEDILEEFLGLCGHQYARHLYLGYGFGDRALWVNTIRGPMDIGYCIRVAREQHVVRYNSGVYNRWRKYYPDGEDVEFTSFHVFLRCCALIDYCYRNPGVVGIGPGLTYGLAQLFLCPLRKGSWRKFYPKGTVRKYLGPMLRREFEECFLEFARKNCAHRYKQYVVLRDKKNDVLKDSYKYLANQSIAS